jgi:hypothetical protein
MVSTCDTEGQSQVAIPDVSAQTLRYWLSYENNELSLTSKTIPANEAAKLLLFARRYQCDKVHHACIALLKASILAKSYDPVDAFGFASYAQDPTFLNDIVSNHSGSQSALSPLDPHTWTRAQVSQIDPDIYFVNIGKFHGKDMSSTYASFETMMNISTSRH